MQLHTSTQLQTINKMRCSWKISSELQSSFVLLQFVCLVVLCYTTHLRTLFKRLRSTDLKLKKVKCNFLKKHIQYLGYIISGEGVTPVPEKLDSI